MGDSSGGPDNSHEAIDFVSNPYKRANIGKTSGAEFKAPPKTSVSTRGRTKTSYGAYRLAAAKAKLRSSQEDFDVQAEKMKTLRLEFPYFARRRAPAPTEITPHGIVAR